MKNEIVIQKVITELKKGSSIIVQSAASLVVNGVQGENNALDILKKIKERLKIIETNRTSITSPLNQSLKTANALFKRLSEPLKEADEIVRSKIISFHEQQEKAAEKEQARREKIQAAHEARGHEVHELTEITPEVGDTTTTKRWTFEVIDICKVPDAYMIVNPGVVREAIRNGIREIPGLRIYQESGLRI